MASNWISVFDENILRRVLKLPEQLKPYIIIPIGYTKEKPKERKRHSTTTFVFFNEFGNKKYDRDIFPIMKYKPEKKEEKKDLFTVIKEKLSKKK